MSKINKHAPGQAPANLGFYRMDKQKIPGKNPSKTVLVTNEFYLTKRLNRAYARETFRILKKKWRIGVYALFFVTLAAGFILLIPVKLPFLGIPLIVLSLYFLFMAGFGYLYQAEIAYRNLKSLYGEPIKMKVEFHDRYFSVVTGEGKLEFLYRQIQHYLSFSEYDIFIVAKEGIIQHGQVIDKRSFTPEELNIYYSILDKNGISVLAE